MRTFIIVLLFALIFFAIEKSEAYTKQPPNCYATLTFEGDVYIPGIQGYSVYLKHVGNQSWQIEKISVSGLNCSGSYSFGFYQIWDVRGVNFQGSATFLAADGLLNLVFEQGPKLPTSKIDSAPAKVGFEF